MCPRIWALFKALALGLAGMGMTSTACWASDPVPEIAWVDSLEQARHLAKIHNKPLMVHFYGDHCPPCRMLEAKAFRNRELVSVLNDHVIATKVNADKHRDIAHLYQVSRWPTDVFLYADGTLMERSVSNQDPEAYARTVERVSRRHGDWALAAVADRESRERSDQHLGSLAASRFQSKIFGLSGAAKTPVKISSADWGLQERIAVSPETSSAPMHSIQVEQHLAKSSREEVVMVSQADHEPMNLPQGDRDLPPALGGFCPVALQDFLKMAPQDQSKGTPWIIGKDVYSVRHRGRIYRCASEQSRQRMLGDPDAFAPILSGFDVVEFARTGDLVNGQCELGFIEKNSGQVFLFSSRANYEEFLRHCDHYLGTEKPPQDRLAHEPTSSSFR